MLDYKLNPYRPTSSELEPDASEGLQCPYCQKHFRLTWSLYIRNPTQKQRCPHCDRIGVIRSSWAYKLLVGLIGGCGLLATLGGAALLAPILGVVTYPIGVVAFYVLVLDFDRRKDERGPLNPLPDEQSK